MSNLLNCGTKKMPKSYETQRLLIKPCTLDDSEFMFELMNSDSWLLYIGDRGIHSVNDAKNYIQSRYISQFKSLRFATYIIVNKEFNKKMGVCGFYDRQEIEGLDFGFAFLAEYEGKGFAFESANKLLYVAKSEFGLKKLAGITLHSNTKSQLLLQKLGFKQTGEIQIGTSSNLFFEIIL